MHYSQVQGRRCFFHTTEQRANSDAETQCALLPTLVQQQDFHHGGTLLHPIVAVALAVCCKTVGINRCVFYVFGQVHLPKGQSSKYQGSSFWRNPGHTDHLENKKQSPLN